MITIFVESELDVLSKYKSLIESSLDGSSLYIRTKETIDALVVNGDLSEVEKAKVISNVLTSLNTSIVNSSMSTALQWAEQEKSIQLKKVEMSYQLALTEEDVRLRKAQIEKTNWDNYITQAGSLRMNGSIQFGVDGKVTSLSDSGKLWEDMQLTKKQALKTTEDTNYLKAKIDETYASTHKAIADTYNTYGSYTYTVANNGVTAVTEGVLPANFVPLAKVQNSIAKGQANGYVLNAWASAMTGSAGTLGTALATGDLPITGDTAGYMGELAVNISTLAEKLGNLPMPYPNN